MMQFKAHYSGRDGNLYSVSSIDGKILLIDPGVSYRKILKAVDMQKVCGALVSHSHLDHCRAVNDLLRRGIKCYASPATINAVGQHHLFNPVYSYERFKIDDAFKICPFGVRHDAQDSLGFCVHVKTGKLLYIPDTPYVVGPFTNLTIIAIECNYNLEQTVNILKANDLSKVREIWLLHLRNSVAASFKERVQKETGKTVYIA
jgi:phosphoribosyl 1,2-cyclic phosphodiesterase